MIQSAFQKIIREFPLARHQRFAGHPIANFIRNDIPELFRNSLPDYREIIWQASAGKGRWVDAPWLASFNPLVTESAMRGYYPVYLFTRTLDKIYLSFNQGMTDLRDEFGDTQSKEILAHRASIIRRRLKHEYQVRFDALPIELQPTGGNTRLAFYEPGHAFGKCYISSEIPSTEILLADMNEMLQLYNLAIARGGTEEFDLEIHHTAEPTQQYSTDMTLVEKRRYRQHRTIERNRRLAEKAKEVHGYVCHVCDFDFELTYGDLGKNYIEAHHLTPIALLSEGQTVSLSPKDDFTVVCANCHSMIHRRDAPESFEEFVNLYKFHNK